MANRQTRNASQRGAGHISAHNRRVLAWLDEFEGALREALAGVEGWRAEIIRDSQAPLAVRVGLKVLQMRPPAKRSKQSSKA